MTMIDNEIRLLFFDIVKGNRIGAEIIIKELGWVKGLQIIGKLKWREINENPFDEINQKKQPTPKEKLSQRQMAPLVILHQLLQEEGFSKSESIALCKKLTKEVAVAFLDFSVPLIRKKDWKGKSKKIKEKKLNEIAGRFFNISDSEQVVDDKDHFTLTVKGCHFAAYARALGVRELGPVFCAADGYYFEHLQKEVQYNRTQTLTDNPPKPCDFSFKWKNG
ncbi:MAG: L-2-amino-thiazoline-4-carboxylic acid hydrolase [Bacteroidetes bacterium]|nr:L-2-amino-thiazoline-4-carboxylic acid hydrolase [Bacteroidota bacterium]